MEYQTARPAPVLAQGGQFFVRIKKQVYYTPIRLLLLIRMINKANNLRFTFSVNYYFRFLADVGVRNACQNTEDKLSFVIQSKK